MEVDWGRETKANHMSECMLSEINWGARGCMLSEDDWGAHDPSYFAH